jgi:hypothetical protein
MTNDDLLNTPILWINKYLQAKLGEKLGYAIPLFPPSPFNIDDLTEKFMILNNESTPISDAVAGTWDRLIKMNKSSFPHIKCEQLMYYFYGLGEESKLTMIQVQEQVFRLMDRGDETAQEINNWCMNRQVELDDGSLIDNMFFFHDFKVYQLEETRDIVDFGTARTYGANKIIIEFDYHQVPVIGSDGKDSVTYSDWEPEKKLATKEII